MTLSFSQYINGNPTYFVEKIWSGIRHYEVCKELADYLSSPYSSEANILDYQPKIHSIRADKKGRWQPGTKIHFVINNRTPNRLQFAPVIKCFSVQEFKIKYQTPGKNREGDLMVFIDDRKLKVSEIEQLAINDGFKNTEDFLNYFSEDFEGKLIHWTNHKY